VTESATTLLDALQKKFPDSSKTTLRKMLQNDRIRVNGAPERDAKRQLGPDDRIDVLDRQPRPIDPRVKILFEDDDLLIVDKAPGLLTVPNENVLYETAETFLNSYAGALPGEQRVHHVHRIDRDTSGVLVFAKTTYVRDQLKELFAAHDIERAYVAVVFGKLKEPSGTFRSFLAEDRDMKVRSVADHSEGKEAITHYRTIASGKRFSILELKLETGRRNQIRVHLAEAGHPIVGDTMYGKGRDESLPRLGLHAKLLAFRHPRTGRTVTFNSEMPREFRELAL